MNNQAEELPCRCRSSSSWWCSDWGLPPSAFHKETASPGPPGQRKPWLPSCWSPALWTSDHQLLPEMQRNSLNKLKKKKKWSRKFNKLCTSENNSIRVVQPPWRSTFHGSRQFLLTARISSCAVSRLAPSLGSCRFLSGWVPGCSAPVDEIQLTSVSHFHFWKSWMRWSNKSKVRPTSSDVAEEVVGALLIGWSSAFTPDAGLGSPPVGRPKSCRTCEPADGKNMTTSSQEVQVTTSLRCAGFRSCLCGHVQLGYFLGGPRSLVGLPQELDGHGEDRLVHWTRLSYESEFQTGSVLVQTHHRIHVEIISDWKENQR